jgi:hypothetical protein
MSVCKVAFVFFVVDVAFLFINMVLSE